MLTTKHNKRRNRWHFSKETICLPNAHVPLHCKNRMHKHTHKHTVHTHHFHFYSSAFYAPVEAFQSSKLVYVLFPLWIHGDEKIYHNIIRFSLQASNGIWFMPQVRQAVEREWKRHREGEREREKETGEKRIKTITERNQWMFTASIVSSSNGRMAKE